MSNTAARRHRTSPPVAGMDFDDGILASLLLFVNAKLRDES